MHRNTWAHTHTHKHKYTKLIQVEGGAIWGGKGIVLVGGEMYEYDWNTLHTWVKMSGWDSLFIIIAYRMYKTLHNINKNLKRNRRHGSNITFEKHFYFPKTETYKSAYT